METSSPHGGPIETHGPDPWLVNYYRGLPHSPQLIARSTTDERIPDLDLDEAGYLIFRRKWACPVSDGHPLGQALGKGLKNAIGTIVLSMKGRVLRVTFWHIEYEDEPEMIQLNPAVIWVKVDRDTITHGEATRVVREILKECER